MIKVYQYNMEGSAPTEYLPGMAANKAGYTIGTALKLSSGFLTKCGATDVPEYICVGDRSAETGTEFQVPVIRVSKEHTYESELSVASASIAIGAKYTLDATASKITATATDGVAEVVAFDGTAAGSRVLVKF